MLIWWLAHIFLLINPPQSNVDHSLGQNREQNETTNPHPPQEWSRAKAKTGYFPILGIDREGGGGGGGEAGGGGGGAVKGLTISRRRRREYRRIVTETKPAKRVFRLYKLTLRLLQTAFGLYTGEGGGVGGPNLPSSVPWIPGSCPLFLGFLSDCQIQALLRNFPLFLSLPPPLNPWYCSGPEEG